MTTALSRFPWSGEAGDEVVFLFLMGRLGD
jgi:hypothetical protein